ncbi:MAG TPA: hypothetical protein VMU53_18775 [Candidatus Sulfotelmatobacter sp.]|nr:hypothetical protein [Candidatus Sulfotelmatobacter sp.]
MRTAAQAAFATCFVALFSVLLPASSSPSADRQPIDEALTWVRNSPQHFVEYDYLMTARVRLLFFWAGKDDVGGGYIRRGVSSDDPRMDFIQVLFGSDPAKAPRAINRWGAGTEVSWHNEPASAATPDEEVTTSAFFGFMKSSQGKSVGEMQSELAHEKERGEHAFTGILSRVEPSRAVSLVVPLLSDTDYNLHDYDRAEPVMLEHLAGSQRPLRTLDDSSRCASSAGFLATVAQLMDGALQGQPAPLSRCYIYDAQQNTLSLEKVSLLESLDVLLHGPGNVVLLNTTHKHLLQLDFTSTHKLTGKKVYFTIYEGTQGVLRGVPVQICYQPNWWFQVVLNLRPEKTAPPDRTVASR